ncbi:hypothetical protein BDP27DRAFT_1322991 [Rhodocollybia butyracea]|uniref:DUF6534 domain-containing protein n=1 Tax=Rhodocollybia butyracea TaxID=206335 RepID=A0A9P5U990_9AGAR|nr:hypothetical protein BDP27DRAFT_1322991 [Rhodocollybia butyracea]
MSYISNAFRAVDSVDVSGTMDGFFYGYAVSTVLFGITVVQTWIYLNNNKDKWPFRILVTMLVLGDFATTCLVTESIHYYLVANFGDTSVLDAITVPMAIEYFLTLLIVFCVQIFFATRVWRLGHFHWTVYASIVLTAIGSLASGLSAAGELANNNNSLLDLSAENSQFEVGWECGLSAVSDVITTIALCWSFNHGQTGINRTDNLLQKLFQYTVTRGLLVTLDQTLFLVLFLTKTQKLWWLPFHLCSSKIYVNTMVAMLNSRTGLQQAFDVRSIITDSDMRTTTITGSQSGRDNTSQPNPDKPGSNDVLGSASAFKKFTIGIPTRKAKEIDDMNDNYIKMNNLKQGGILITQERLPPQDI